MVTWAAVGERSELLIKSDREVAVGGSFLVVRWLPRFDGLDAVNIGVSFNLEADTARDTVTRVDVIGRRRFLRLELA